MSTIDSALTENLPREAVTINLTAIHESGHAVAAFRLWQLHGRSPASAVRKVTIYSVPSPPGQKWFGGATASDRLWPAISRAAMALYEYHREFDDDDQTGFRVKFPDALRVASGATGTIPVQAWANSEIMMAMGGPIAQATALGESVWNSRIYDESWNGDWWEGWRASLVAGLTGAQRQSALMGTVERLTKYFSRPPVWNALLHLAAALPEDGAMEGPDCWRIYSRALRQPEKMILLKLDANSR